MSARDDFNSGARSPGGWGGQGNMNTQAGAGGHGSLGGGSGSNASGMGGIKGVGGGFGSNVGGLSAGGNPTGVRNDRGTAYQQLNAMFGPVGGKGSGRMGSVRGFPHQKYTRQQFPGGWAGNVFRKGIPGLHRPPAVGAPPEEEVVVGVEPEFDPNAWNDKYYTVDSVARRVEDLRKWNEMMERTAAWRDQKVGGWGGPLSGPQAPTGGKQFYDRVPQSTGISYKASAAPAPSGGYMTNPFTQDGRGFTGMRDTYRAALSNRNTY